MKPTYIILLVVLLVSCAGEIKSELETSEVKKGQFYIDLVEEGEINATNSINISSPAISWRFGSLKIIEIVEDGTKVGIGDTVMQFDPSEVQKAILDAEAELEIAKAELERLKAQHASRIEELKSAIEISEISHKISEINLEQATFDAEITKREIKLTLDKAVIAMDKAREEIINQEKIHLEEIKQSQLKIRQLETNLREAHSTLESMTVVTRAPGIAILRRNWATGNKWQVGDQPWPGSMMIDLPDLDELKVEAEVSEIDISKVILGQQAEIKLDAFADTVFSGKVISIANLAQFKNRDSKIKVFPVEVLIDGSSDIFLPGMTVSCRIIIDKIDDVLFVPLESIFPEEKKYFVYVKSGNSYDKREVVTRQKNNDHIIIEEGLETNDVVALSNPFPEDEQLKN